MYVKGPRNPAVALRSTSAGILASAVDCILHVLSSQLKVVTDGDVCDVCDVCAYGVVFLFGGLRSGLLLVGALLARLALVARSQLVLCRLFKGTLYFVL